MKKKQELTIEEQAHRDRVRDLCCGIFVLTVIVWFLRFCLGGLASLAAPHLNYYLASSLKVLAEGISVALPFFVFLKFRRDPVSFPFRDGGEADRPAVRTLLGILSVASLSAAGMGIAGWLLSLLESFGVHSAVTVPDYGSNLAQTVFTVVLSSAVSAFVYETAYRGIALKVLKEENELCAVLVSGIAFALLDGHPYLLVVRLFIGFLLGWFYLRVPSLWACTLLTAVSHGVIHLWQILMFRPEMDFYVPFLVLIGLVLGIAAAFFLFFPRRKPAEGTMATPVALGLLFKSFGIYLMLTVVAFNMLVFTFSMDADPADPLLQPTPEEGQKDPLHFDRDEEFMDEYGTLNPEIKE